MAPTGTPLLSWLDDPSSERSVHFSTGPDSWLTQSYADLAHGALRVAGGLAAHGVRRDDRVLLILRSARDFTTALFGTLAAGASATPLGRPSSLHAPAQFDEHLARVAALLQPRLAVVDAARVKSVQTVLDKALGEGVARAVSVESLEAADPAPRTDAAQYALLQFTSGSTSNPRCVRVPYSALEANMLAIALKLHVTGGYSSAHWLPFHHDMGLIGGLLIPVRLQTELWNMRPGDFLHDPLRYLRCFGEFGATVGTMPNFGLEHVASRITPDDLAGLDFAGWRAVVIGAERLNPAAFRRFTDLLGPVGFDPKALMPAYGMAENTLAVTALSLDRPPRYLALDDEGRAAPEGPDRPATVVGCGTPIEGAEVAIVDEDGRELPEGEVGEILVRGTSLADGYLPVPGEPASETAFGADGLHTGDAGFLRDGELFVLGRLGDGIKIRGLSVFAEDVELSLTSTGLAGFQSAVLLGFRGGRPTAVALLEEATAAQVDAARTALVGQIEGADAVVLEVPFRTIRRTTSGKPRRRAMWTAFLAGEFDTVARSGDLPDADADSDANSPSYAAPGDAVLVSTSSSGER